MFSIRDLSRYNAKKMHHSLCINECKGSNTLLHGYMYLITMYVVN